MVKCKLFGIRGLQQRSSGVFGSMDRDEEAGFLKSSETRHRNLCEDYLSVNYFNALLFRPIVDLSRNGIKTV